MAAALPACYTLGDARRPVGLGRQPLLPEWAIGGAIVGLKDGARSFEKRHRHDNKIADHGDAALQAVDHRREQPGGHNPRIGDNKGPARAQLRRQLAVALQQHHLGRAARGGLEAERPAAGEGIQAAPALQVLSQPVEQGFAHAVRGRPQAGGGARP